MALDIVLIHLSSLCFPNFSGTVSSVGTATSAPPWITMCVPFFYSGFLPPPPFRSSLPFQCCFRSFGSGHSRFDRAENTPSGSTLERQTCGIFAHGRPQSMRYYAIELASILLCNITPRASPVPLLASTSIEHTRSRRQKCARWIDVLLRFCRPGACLLLSRIPLRRAPRRVLASLLSAPHSPRFAICICARDCADHMLPLLQLISTDARCDSELHGLQRRHCVRVKLNHPHHDIY